MKNKTLLFLISFLQILLLSGCMRNTELDQLAFFSGVGIDFDDEKKYELTLQLILHRELKIQAQTGNLPSQNVIVYGNTFSGAINNFVLQAGRRGVYSHCKTLVMGDDFAKDGISEFLDILQRSYEIRDNTLLFISKGKARQILDAETTTLETIQSFNLSDMLEQYALTGKTYPVDIHQYLLQSSEGTGSTFIPYVETLSGESLESSTSSSSKTTNALQLNGMAILKDQKLVGLFDDNETVGLLFIRGSLKNAIINVAYPTSTEIVDVRLHKSKRKLTPIFENGQLASMHLKVEAYGQVLASQHNIDGSNPEVINILNDETAKKIEEIIRLSLKKGQQLNADIFEFSTMVYRADPHYWKDIESSWDQVFSSLQMDIEVKVEIERTGLVNKAIQ